MLKMDATHVVAQDDDRKRMNRKVAKTLQRGREQQQRDRFEARRKTWDKVRRQPPPGYWPLVPKNAKRVKKLHKQIERLSFEHMIQDAATENDGRPGIPKAVTRRRQAMHHLHYNKVAAARKKHCLRQLLRHDDHAVVHLAPRQGASPSIAELRVRREREAAGVPDQAWSKFLREHWEQIQPQARASIVKTARRSGSAESAFSSAPAAASTTRSTTSTIRRSSGSSRMITGSPSSGSGGSVRPRTGSSSRRGRRRAASGRRAHDEA